MSSGDDWDASDNEAGPVAPAAPIIKPAAARKGKFADEDVEEDANVKVLAPHALSAHHRLVLKRTDSQCRVDVGIMGGQRRRGRTQACSTNRASTTRPSKGHHKEQDSRERSSRSSADSRTTSKSL